MDTKSTTMIIRLPGETKEAFAQVAKEQDLTASQLLRALIRETIATHTPPLQGLKEPPEAKKKATVPTKPKKPAKHAGSALVNALLKRS